MKTPGIQLTFDFDLTPTGIDNAVSLLKYADKLGVSTSEGTAPQAPPPPPKGKDKPAPAPAPKGKAPAAAKANSKGKPKEPEPDIMDLNLGDDEDEDEETGGLGLADDDDAEEGFDGTAEEAREEALAKLRVMLSGGMTKQLKEVQKVMQVAKFHDVPVEKGFEFLKAVKEVEAKIARN